MNDCEIIEKSMGAKDKKGWLYGGAIYAITQEELDALRQGKCLCTNINDEYRIFIELEDGVQ